jgi:hypothetical protein
MGYLKLKVGKIYILKRTGEFSHAVGAKGFKEFSKNLNSSDTTEAIFVGCVPSGHNGSSRNIFYSENDVRKYLSFGTTKLDYVISKKAE